MTDKISLRIYDLVGGPVWVSSDDGQKVFDKIAAAFKSGRAVELSFANHENLISAFLNAAIGQLYNGTYDEAFLQQNLKFADVTDDVRAMLERTVANAKRYFANQERYDQAWREVVDENDE